MEKLIDNILIVVQLIMIFILGLVTGFTINACMVGATVVLIVAIPVLLMIGNCIYSDMKFNEMIYNRV